MVVRIVVAALAVTVGITGPAFAQVPRLHTPGPARVEQSINLNTASQTELEKLPLIGPAPAKAIIEARSKAKFKDWPDFVARKVVSKVHEDAIKDRVGF